MLRSYIMDFVDFMLLNYWSCVWSQCGFHHDVSPGYNRNGWLGVKDQLTYSSWCSLSWCATRGSIFDFKWQSAYTRLISYLICISSQWFCHWPLSYGVFCWGLSTELYMCNVMSRIYVMWCHVEEDLQGAYTLHEPEAHNTKTIWSTKCMQDQKEHY